MVDQNTGADRPSKSLKAADVTADQNAGQSTEVKTAPAVNEQPIAKRILEFKGHLFPKGYLVNLQTVTPKGVRVKDTRRYDWLERGYILRVSGAPELNSRGEYSTTVDIQYAPSKTLRLTATSQFVDPVIAMLKGNVHEDGTLKTPVMVSAALEEMRQGTRGYNVVELYLIKEDGTSKTIIGPADNAISGAGNAGAPMQQFM